MVNFVAWFALILGGIFTVTYALNFLYPSVIQAPDVTVSGGSTLTASALKKELQAIDYSFYVQKNALLLGGYDSAHHLDLNYHYGTFSVDINSIGAIQAVAFFGSGAGLTGVTATADVNGQDLNIHDLNARSVSATAFFGSGVGITGIVATGDGFTATLDVNALERAYLFGIDWNSSLQRRADLNDFFVQKQNLPYIPSEADIDLNAMAWDTNSDTACDGNTVLTGSGICQSITDFYLSGTGGLPSDMNQTYYSQLDANRVLQSKADLNANFYGKLDVNAHFVPFIGSTKDVNLNFRDLNARQLDANRFFAKNGSLAFPAYSFSSSPNSGMYTYVDGGGNNRIVLVDQGVIALDTYDSITTITGALYAASFNLKDAVSGNFLRIAPTDSSLTTTRNLYFDVVNADRTLTISGNSKINQDVSTAGSPQFSNVTVTWGGYYNGDGSQLSGLTNSVDLNNNFYGKLDVNAGFVPFIGSAKDVNLNFKDLNAKSISAVAFFGSGAALTGLPSAGLPSDMNQAYYSQLDANRVLQSKVDLNANFYGKLDVNRQFVPYIGAVRDVNLNYYDLNARSIRLDGNLQAKYIKDGILTIGNGGLVREDWMLPYTYQLPDLIYPLVGNRFRLDNYILKYRTNDLPVATADVSGGTYNPITGTVFAVSNGTPIMYEFGIDGNWLRTITLTNFLDTEGIAWMYGTTFAICQERTPAPYIHVVTIDASTTSLNAADFNSTRITPNITITTNQGMEGVTFDQDNRWFYVSVEKQAAGGNGGRVFKVLFDGTATEYTTLDANLLAFGFNDLADIYYDRESKHVFLLAQEQNTIIEAELTGRILKMKTIPLAWFAQPEGLSFSLDGANMFIFGEADDYAHYVLNPVQNLDVNYNAVQATAFFGSGAALTGVLSQTDVNANFYGKLDVNAAFVPYVSATKDVNLNFRDLNAKSISAVAFFGSGAGLTGLPSSGGTVTIDANTAEYNWLQADTNKNYYGKLDVNRQFVPYIGATRDLNLNGNDFNARDIQGRKFRITDANSAYGTGAIALGLGATAFGDLSTVIGTYSTAIGEGSIAIGSEIEVDGTNSVGIGTNANTKANYATSIGFNTLAIGVGSLALGYAGESEYAIISAGNGSIAGGYASDPATLIAGGIGAIALGYNTKAFGDGSVSLGYDNNASVNYATAIGYKVFNKNSYSVALGPDVNVARDLNVMRDANIVRDLNVGRAISASKYFGDGSGLTNLPSGLTWNDINAHVYGKLDVNRQFVPYIGAVFDVNLNFRDLNVGNFKANRIMATDINVGAIYFPTMGGYISGAADAMFLVPRNANAYMSIETDGAGTSLYVKPIGTIKYLGLAAFPWTSMFATGDVNGGSATFTEKAYLDKGAIAKKDLNVSAGINKGVSISADTNRVCFPSNSCEMMIDYNSTAMIFSGG